jgi:CRP/FNR family transcriptional regulator
MSVEELSEVGRRTIRRTFRAGTPILFEGDNVRAENIGKGVVHLSKGLSDCRQQIVGLQFSSALLPARISQVTAQAATDSELCAVPNALLDDNLGRNPKVEDAMYKQTLDEQDRPGIGCYLSDAKPPLKSRESYSDVCHEGWFHLRRWL